MPRYRNERWIGFDYLPVQRADAVTTIDTSLQFETRDGDWQVMAYARNLTNEGVESITQTLGLVDNVISTVYEPPRTVGIRVSYHYF
ncbi:TonB-dependent receptor [Aestuariibacter sp. GS-14]|uniref:TonB-dependent receptor n=1 Tax=Aestuariibacter sp. GS-14 TaxID=2590670 RepID=UPI0015E83CC8|nr:TonB-dependent receptor [Aestuariibacter sp. GS-14]